MLDKVRYFILRKMFQFFGNIIVVGDQILKANGYTVSRPLKKNRSLCVYVCVCACVCVWIDGWTDSIEDEMNM